MPKTDPRNIENLKKSGNGVYTPKGKFLTRHQIDGRTNAVREFDAIASGIAADLGGTEQLSTVQKHLVEAFAGVAIQVQHLNVCLLLGENVDVLAHSNAISTMVRVASRIGVQRIPRDIITPPDVASYVDYARQQDDESS